MEGARDMKLKEKDLFILSYLRDNARVSLTELGRKTNFPISTIHDRIKLIEDNFVTKYTTIIDFSKLGFNYRAKLFIKTAPDCRNDLLSSLMEYKNVNSVFKIDGDYDLMLDVIAKDKEEFESIVKKVDRDFPILNHRTIEIVDEIKNETFFSDFKDKFDVVSFN